MNLPSLYKQTTSQTDHIIRGIDMNDFFTWLGFFGAPLLLALITVYVYRPSARPAYQEAKRIPFLDTAGKRARRHRR